MIRTIKSVLVLVLLSAGMFTAVTAQTSTPAPGPMTDPAKQVKVEELFKLMHLEQTYGQLMTQMLSQSQQTVNGLLPESSTLSAAQKKEAADFQAKVQALVMSSFSWSALKPDYVKLYADTYSYEDLDGIINFYQSPVGQKMLATTPELMKQSSAIAMNHMQEVQPKMREMLEDFQEQIQAEQSSPK